jgi:hypothetical protein
LLTCCRSFGRCGRELKGQSLVSGGGFSTARHSEQAAGVGGEGRDVRTHIGSVSPHNHGLTGPRPAVFSRRTGCRFRNPAADAHCDDRNRSRRGRRCDRLGDMSILTIPPRPRRGLACEIGPRRIAIGAGLCKVGRRCGLTQTARSVRLEAGCRRASPKSPAADPGRPRRTAPSAVRGHRRQRRSPRRGCRQPIPRAQSRAETPRWT